MAKVFTSFIYILLNYAVLSENEENFAVNKHLDKDTKVISDMKETITIQEQRLHNLEMKCSKCGLLNGKNSQATNSSIGFTAYISAEKSTPEVNLPFIFDHVVTNIGGLYNENTGIFNTEVEGLYVFTWTVACGFNGIIYTELVVASPQSAVIVVANLLTDANAAAIVTMNTGLAVVSLKQRDSVYVRTPPGIDDRGPVLSNSNYRSSFSGWKLL